MCLENTLNGKFQSGYKTSHSTETALLRVRSDIVDAIDKKHAVFLVLLDLSVAFDNVDYPVLINRLNYTYDIIKVPHRFGCPRI